MKRNSLALALGVALTVVPFALPATVSLASLVSTFLDNVVASNQLFKNEFGIKSYVVKGKRKANDQDTVVTVEFACGGKTCTEQIVYRILDAEMFVTEEKSLPGIGGLARIEWTWGPRTDPRRLQGIGSGMENYLVLSKKDGAWVSPKDDAWVPGAFREVKSHWTDKKGRHETLRSVK